MPLKIGTSLCYLLSALYILLVFFSYPTCFSSSYLLIPSLVHLVKNPPAMWETWVRSLVWEYPLEEGMATHSSVLAWRIPMDKEVWWVIGHEVGTS